jgi:hypothetical protein
MEVLEALVVSIFPPSAAVAVVAVVEALPTKVQLASFGVIQTMRL